VQLCWGGYAVEQAQFSKKLDAPSLELGSSLFLSGRVAHIDGSLYQDILVMGGAVHNLLGLISPPTFRV
jgi:hypothetical protein